MESASHMAHHDNMCGPLLQLVMKQSAQITGSIPAVHVSTPLLEESSLALLALTTIVKLAAGHNLNNATTLMTLSGMVRGVRGRMSAVTEEDHGSVSSCLSQLKMTLR